jgi:hypothetical protein
MMNLVLPRPLSLVRKPRFHPSPLVFDPIQLHVAHLFLPQDDPPPSYTSHGQFSPSTRSFLPKPTNFVSISKMNGSVKGSWVIDPTLSIPASFLPALEENEIRKNFSVASKNGAIDVDLTIMQTSNDNLTEATKKRATIHLSSHNGILTTTLVGLPCQPLYIPISSYRHNSTVHRAHSLFLVHPSALR